MNNRVVPFSWKQASKTCPSLPLLPVNFSSLAWQPWFCLSFFMVYVVWPFDHCWCFLPAGLHHPGNMVPQLGTTVSHLCKVKWKDQFIVLLLTPYFSHFFFFLLQCEMLSLWCTYRIQILPPLFPVLYIAQQSCQREIPHLGFALSFSWLFLQLVKIILNSSPVLKCTRRLHIICNLISMLNIHSQRYEWKMLNRIRPRGKTWWIFNISFFF